MEPEIVRDGRLILVKIGPLGFASNNAYILADAETNDAVVIDAPEGSEQVLPHLAGFDLNGVIVTHRHRDHWAGIEQLLAGVQAPVLTHEADREPYAQFVNATIEDGDELDMGGLKLRILHTPGHTPGSFCILVGEHLLSGDTLFPGGPGRTRSNADLQQEIASITSQLYSLPDNVHVYPGHGANTTIAVSRGEYAVFASKRHDPGLAGDVLWVGS